MRTKVASCFAASAICAVALFALSSCGGGGGGGGSIPGPTSNPTSNPTQPPATPTLAPTPTPIPTPTPSPPGPSSQTIHAFQGAVNGQKGGYTPAEGDMPNGGQGSPIDNVTCDPTMFEQTYHVHIFLGVYNNGTLMAVPPGTGMFMPQPPDKTGFVNFAQCFYHLHTHDSSGIVHIEDPRSLPLTQTVFTLKTYLDIWGLTADANHFGPFHGPVRVFTSGQVPRGNTNNGLVTADTLTFYGTDPTNIPLYSHELIFVEIGPTYPASLPNVSFYTQF